MRGIVSLATAAAMAAMSDAVSVEDYIIPAKPHTIRGRAAHRINPPYEPKTPVTAYDHARLLKAEQKRVRKAAKARAIPDQVATEVSRVGAL